MNENSTISCFDSHSDDYDAYQTIAVPHYQEMLEIVAMTCQRYLAAKDSAPDIIDLGCGSGNASRAILQHMKASTFLIDGSDRMVAIALDKLNKGFPGAVAGYRVADLANDNWDEGLISGKYEAIVSTLVLEHLPFDRYKSVIKKCHDLLSPGGWMIVVEGYVEKDSDMIEWFHSQIKERIGNLDPKMAEMVTSLRDDKEVHYYTSKLQKEEWWREAGFIKVNVIWQYLCIAMMVGQKP
jgi:SAM-dependent methyltransferase